MQLVDGSFTARSLAWVADADDGSFGLEGAMDAASCSPSPTATRPSPSGSARKAKAASTALVDGRPEVFVAPLALRELAKRIYVSRAALRVEPSRVESVKVISKGKTVWDETRLCFARRPAASSPIAWLP